MHQDERECQEHHQFNFGQEQRCAARDYYELVPPVSIEMLLLMSSQEKLDHLSLDNSRLFQRRFRFEPPREVRRQIIDLQKKYDLSDREIQRLRHSGQMQITRKAAKLEATRLGPVIGWFQLIMLTLVCLDMVLHVCSSTAAVPKQALGLLFIGLVWTACAWMLNYIYLAPWLLLKRSGVIPGGPVPRNTGSEQIVAGEAVHPEHK